MNRLLLLISFLLLNLNAEEIPHDVVKKRSFEKRITLNSQVVQKNQVQEHTESRELSELLASQKTLKIQLKIAEENHYANKKLFRAGVISQKQRNATKQILDNIFVKLSNVKQQLSVHNGMKMSQMFTKGDTIMLKSYVPLSYATSLKIGNLGEVHYAEKMYPIEVAYIFPQVDARTQQVVILSRFTAPMPSLFLGAYIDASLYVGVATSYLSVTKSALSFYNNEWVVFTPEHDEHDEHEGHDEEEVPFNINIVKIITQNNHYVAIEGLKEGVNYVSDKSYIVKSLLLKSSLGGHGH